MSNSSDSTELLDALLAEAVQLHQRGQLEGARRLYAQVLAAAPEHVDALHFLGVLAHQIGLHDEAIELIGRAISRAPAHADAHLNLGNVFLRVGKLDAAAACYERVLALRPDSAAAHTNLGTVWRGRGDESAAIAAYQRAIACDPGHADAHFNLGNALQRSNQIDAAVDAYLQAISLKPFATRVHRVLGMILYAIGRPLEAATVYRNWLQLEPGNPTASHMLAACTGGTTPARASDAYVRETFDRFADSFESKLAELDYQAPQLILEAVSQLFAAPTAALQVLDAGCGTGLCGPLLRPWARGLAGVDLSLGMLEKARERGLYDELTHGELGAFLRARRNRYDLIASADTLVYIGALDAVAAAAAAALRPGGAFVFTVETFADDTSPDRVILGPHGRYTHGRAHVHEALSNAGMTLEILEPVVLRTELNQPVPGLLVAGRAAGTGPRISR